ncbi:MAG: translation elongation factor Ts [Candidatus Melainabacteria bacterium LEY3_CP_29_8]|nr:MAG: translation elongation factor Ts [Candidatus Melainabacteria bacterium LEY3_CP_29_8]
MTITAQMVKELREKTGAGILDAKKALVENDGDMEKAMEFLRQKGIASADKKMGRIAAEGVVCTLVEGNQGAIVEVNCETDFVAKNEEFKEFVNCITKTILKTKPADVDSLLASNACCDESKTVEDKIKEKIATIGEKITLRRFETYEGNLATYVHNGKIGVMIQTSAKDDALAKDVCLHIASCAPQFITRDEIPQSVIDEETRIEMGKEDLAKKPENIRAKIVEGRVNKLMAQKCLLEQAFVKDPNQTIAQLIEGKFDIIKFTRYELGEGLEKKQENFAQEVMEQMKK